MNVAFSISSREINVKKENGDNLTLSDLDDYLKNKIIETEDKK